MNLAGAAEPKDIWLPVNYHAVGHAIDINDVREAKPSTSVARFTLPEGIIHDGQNELIIRYENSQEPMTILGIDVLVG